MASFEGFSVFIIVYFPKLVVTESKRMSPTIPRYLYDAKTTSMMVAHLRVYQVTQSFLGFSERACIRV